MNFTFGDDSFYNDQTLRGLVGLRNLGNTCYMNAALQCLSNCPPLREYFQNYLPIDFESNEPQFSMSASLMYHQMLLNKTSATNDQYTNKQLVVAFSQLISKVWSDSQRYNIAPTFLLMEFLRCFLDGLHNEIKTPIRKWELDIAEKDCTTRSSSGSDDPLESNENSNSTCHSSRNDLDDIDNFETADSGLSSDTDISLSIPTIEQLEMMREAVTESEKASTSNMDSGISSETDFSFSDYPNNNDIGYFYWLYSFASRWLFQPWYGWMSYFYRYIFTSSISLENCLKAFFSADMLHGEDMYSCEKCKKLRNGIKQCELTHLPEILCIHLKRFRHDNLYNYKVNTKVTFPIVDLDMREFLSDSVLKKDTTNELNTEYDLIAIVSHRGNNVDYGHYIAYCRNDVDKNWYEFDDSLVTRVNALEVMSREAYVLFYQKKTTTPNIDISSISK